VVIGCDVCSLFDLDDDLWITLQTVKVEAESHVWLLSKIARMSMPRTLPVCLALTKCF
jgi:hypothetical protein